MTYYDPALKQHQVNVSCLLGSAPVINSRPNTATLTKCWASVVDGFPALKQRCLHVIVQRYACLLVLSVSVFLALIRVGVRQYKVLTPNLVLESAKRNCTAGGPGILFFREDARCLSVISKGTFQALKQLIFQQLNTEKYLWKLVLKILLIN